MVVHFSNDLLKTFKEQRRKLIRNVSLHDNYYDIRIHIQLFESIHVF